MANTLTDVLPQIQQAADTVSRELVGFVPAVFRNSSAERAGLNQNVDYDIVPEMTAADITPSNTSSTGTDQVISKGSMSISNSRKVSFHYTGEQQQSMSNGPLAAGILQRQFEQAMRTLCNEIEEDLWQAAYQGSSRGYGTAGTAPFASAAVLTDIAEVRRILEDNGSPQNDLHCVLGNAEWVKLRGIQSNLFKVNEAGTPEFLRRGSLGELMGFQMHQSGAITTHTKGTGASYLLNDASSSVGDTTITVDTGSGTILAGDIVTIAGTSDKYVVNSALSGGSFTIGAPGLVAAEADNDAITVGNSYRPNVVFDRNAVHLITRAPAMPAGGDSADDVIEVVDSFSGLAFQVALYRQYRQVSFEVGIAWGCKAVKSAHIATLLG